jgi:hypothetical protein
MNPLPIVAYDRDVHEASYLELLGRFFGAREAALRRRVLSSMHERMPRRERVPLRHVVVDGDRVVASMGHMPADFWVRGKVVPVRFTHDLLVDSEYRGVHFLGKRLLDNAFASGAFFPGGMWMTDPSYRLHLVCGFDSVTPMTTYTLVLNPAAFVARKGLRPPVRTVSRYALEVPLVFALRASRRAGDATIAAVDRLHPALDPQWARMASGYGVTRFRDAEYLNWKYADHPYQRYRIALAARGGDTVGFLIWRPASEGADDRRAVVVDFLVEKGDSAAFRSLTAHAIGGAREAGMESLSVLTTQSWAQRVLRSLGFFPRGTRNTWVVAGWREHIPAEWLIDTEPWHVCMGDSDGDIWSDAG